MGVGVIVAGGMGGGAVTIFEERGVEVVAARPATPRGGGAVPEGRAQVHRRGLPRAHDGKGRALRPVETPFPARMSLERLKLQETLLMVRAPACACRRALIIKIPGLLAAGARHSRRQGHGAKTTKAGKSQIAPRTVLFPRRPDAAPARRIMPQAPLIPSKNFHDSKSREIFDARLGAGARRSSAILSGERQHLAQKDLVRRIMKFWIGIKPWCR
jgi:hypothetical protein